MSAASNKLLQDVCVRLGFCGSVVDGQLLHVDHFLPETGVLTNEEFADALFKAEGWDPNGSEAKNFRSSVREAFVRHMGGAEIEGGWRDVDV